MKADQAGLTACHWALLRLAGTAPDELLTQCRQWLAQGRTVDVARATTHAAVSYHVGLGADEIEALGDLLEAVGDERRPLPTEDATDEHPVYVFAMDRQLMRTATQDSEPVTASAL